MKKNLRFLLSFVCALAVLLSLAVPAALSADVPLQYVVLGDSIGYGAGVINSEEACFGRIVADTNGYGYQNHAVNGYRSESLLRHLDRKEVAEAVGSADIISISIGGNDYLTNNVWGLVFDANVRNDYTRMDKITAQLKQNFAAVIEKIRSANPDVTILTQTLYNPGQGYNRAPYQAAVDRLNALIRDYLTAHPGAYTIIDVAAAFENDMSYIAPDNVHPNAKGNEKIASLVLQALKDLGLGEKTEPVILHKGVEQNDRSLSALRLRVQSFFKLLRMVKLFLSR